MALTLALPLTVANSGALACLTQNSPEEISQSVALLLDTRPGERATVPGYGLPSPIGSGLQADQVVGVIREWEERALDSRVEGVLDRVVEQAAVHSTTTDQGAS